MSSVLTTPTEGTIDLDIDRNDSRFNTLNEAIEAATTFYSEAVNVASKVGIQFPGDKIKPTNAVELFVEPFSGDWNQIIACGDAVSKAGNGLQTVAQNLLAGMAQLFSVSGGTWEGEAASSFYSHLGVHVAVYEGAGLVVEQGDIVFDGIAEVAQVVGGLIVELIDTAIDLAVRLLERLARYARPWIGWVALGWDVATDGWSAIQDAIDDLNDLVDTVREVFNLHEAVSDWVETVPAQLEVFAQIWEIVQTIPDLSTTPILTAAQIASLADGVVEDQAALDEQQAQAESAATEATEALDDLADDVEAPATTPEIDGIEVPETED